MSISFSFKPKKGINRVTVGGDPRVTITAEEPHETSDRREVAALLKNPHLDHEELSNPAAGQLAKAHTRDELVELARDADVENPEALKSKKALAEAIVAARGGEAS